jgi:hypothetical protein
MNETEVLDRLVSCFESNSHHTSESSNVVVQKTNVAALQEIYSILPAKFPILYEQLVLSYRWDRSNVGLLILLANPVGPDLRGLQNEFLADKSLYEGCVQNGFIQFGFAAGGSYDPVCFDTKSASHRERYRVVVLNHEDILCNRKIKVRSVLANSFDELALSLIREI